MNDIQIKKESLPARCEICHQSDYFNPTLNLCLRCNSLENQQIVAKINDNQTSGAHLRITQRWGQSGYHPIHLLGLLVMLFTIPIICLFIFGLSGLLTISDSEMMTFFATTIYLWILILIVSVIAALSKTIITIQDGWIVNQVFSFPYYKFEKLHIAEINNIARIKSWMPKCFRIVANLNNGKKKIVLDYLTQEKSIIIERHIKDRL